MIVEEECPREASPTSLFESSITKEEVEEIGALKIIPDSGIL